ncbi:unnamed protein product [Oppiella nova]|uniref:Uncharacterized protein n=1 Tax=Oppiella nova TaxID=334625 RepID=A0A7R9QW70_9ACAR|nr:unnamed protein product [Oppiella nova]CAG2177323.1 unnamed protein product [Oppiella nova]
MRHILIVLSFMFIVANNYWLNCVADDDLEKLHKIQSLLCVPNKTDTAIMDKVIECEHKHNQTAEEIAFAKKLAIKLTDCAKKADVSAYTKVDQTVMERKGALIMYCDKEFFNCMVKVFVDNKDLMDEHDRLNKPEDKAVEVKTHQCILDVFKN